MLLLTPNMDEWALNIWWISKSIAKPISCYLLSRCLVKAALNHQLWLPTKANNNPRGKSKTNNYSLYLAAEKKLSAFCAAAAFTTSHKTLIKKLKLSLCWLLVRKYIFQLFFLPMPILELVELNFGSLALEANLEIFLTSLNWAPGCAYLSCYCPWLYY